MIKNALLGLGLLITAPIFAFNQVQSIVYSPYVDMTLNVHWDSQYQDIEPADLLVPSQAAGINHYHLAFITDAGVCQPAWGAQADYSVEKVWGKHLTDKLRENRIQYIVSFGGASNNDISKNCNETQLIAAYEKALTVYQPQGLDFDIENGTADVAKVMRALQKIQALHSTLKISFTLPVMPEGLTYEGENIIKQAKQAGLLYQVNIMAMDYGPQYVNDMGQYAIQAASSLFNFIKSLYPEKTDSAIWSMIEVTPMIGVNDVSVEEFTLKNAATLKSFAKQNQLGGLSMWSISRDKPCSDKWTSSLCSGNNLQTQPYEFSREFLKDMISSESTAKMN